MLRTSIAVLGLVGATVLAAASPNLDIYWIDAEGGAATLIVSPSGQSLLVDTANRAPEDRDAKRIFTVAQLAGLKKIDMLVTTHYHGDHVGAMEALSKMIPIEQYIDHGMSVEYDRPAPAKIYDAYVALAGSKRRIVKAGDKIPLKGADITVVMAAGKPIAKPLKGGGPNPLCSDWQDHAADMDPENNQSVGFLLTFGKFKFLDLGDLPWNYEKFLACPTHLVGAVDLYQTTHHGLDRSNSPQIVMPLKPRVMVMNNGPRKGGPPAVFELLRKDPDLQDIWQGHLALATPKEINTGEQMIANMEPSAECKGNWIKASVAPDGKYTITNSRNGYSKTYESR
jgi:beta-lactamase superfamily II metal-dependent hydrolase